MNTNLPENPIPIYSVYPQKCAVIIDGGYWEKILESVGHPNIDLLKLSESLSKPAYRMRTYYFDGKHEARQSIHDQLEMLERFEVVLGDVVEREAKCPICNKTYKINEQKRVDVLIAVNLVHLASTKQVDTIVLIAGDRDFLPVVEVAKDAGVIVRLAYSGKGYSKVAPGLLKSADERIKLTKGFLQPFIFKDTVEKKIEKTDAKEIEDRLEIIHHVERSIKELIRTKSKRVINPSELSVHLKEQGIEFAGTLKNLLENTREKNILSIDKDHTCITLLNEKEAIELIYTGLKENEAVQYMFRILTDLIEKSETDLVSIHSLSATMYNENPNWKNEYNCPKRKAFTKLIEKANFVLNVTGESFQTGEVGFNSRLDCKKFIK